LNRVRGPVKRHPKIGLKRYTVAAREFQYAYVLRPADLIPGTEIGLCKNSG
jgi:hypothetical protein